MGQSITYVSVDDWAGLYLDGALVFESHSVPAFEWIDTINKTQGDVTAEELRLKEPEADEWVEGEGGFPPYLGEIPEDLRV
jgi:hypothetical protein